MFNIKISRKITTAFTSIVLLTFLSMGSFDDLNTKNVKVLAISSQTFVTTGDAHVISTFPTQNYGLATSLREDTTPVINSYIKFNVTGITQPIIKATLRLNAKDSSSVGYRVYTTGNGWTETGINYSNRPAMGNQIDSISFTTANQWSETTVTSAVSGNGEVSFLVVTSDTTVFRFGSKQSGVTIRPQLVIETDGSGTTSTPITDTPTRTFTPSVSNTPSRTPTLPPITFTPSITPTTGVGSGVMIGVGDIANCSHNNDEATAKLIDAVPNARVFTLGDNVYPDGSPQQFSDCYNPTWGRFKDRTYPSVGNHDYHTTGASGYSNYFGALKVGQVGHLYYSYDFGGWHVIALDSEGDMSASSAQMTWLKNDLAQNTEQCTMAMWHHPRWSTGNHGNSNRPIAVWQELYNRGVDLVLNGHDHTYERFKPQNPSGQADPSGIREFVVGTGGAGLYPFTTSNPNTEIRNNTTFGVLKLTLTSSNYSWQFIPVAGQSFTDSGTASCTNDGHGGVVVPSSTASRTPTRTATQTLSLTPTRITSTATPTSTEVVSTPVTISFIQSNDDIRNPRRGFMKQSSIFIEQPDPTKIKALNVTDSLIWVYLRLDNYRTRPLDAIALNGLQSTLSEVRNKKLKVVLRFNYNECVGSGSPCEDATIQIVRQHLQQLSPVLNANADILEVVQVGFVGHWGEWHSTRNLHPLEFRSEIVNTLLDILPPNIFIQLRYPRYAQMFFIDPTTASEAFTGIDKARVGIHNDCFLCDDSDGGTYSSTTPQLPKQTSLYCQGSANVTECWKQFTAQQTSYAPFGGEASKVNPPRSECASALIEMDRMNTSFLNNGFRIEVLNGWTNGGCMDDIRLRLGYRFVLKTLQAPSSVENGSPLNLNIKISNVGFAQMFSPQPVYIVLSGNGQRHDLPVVGTDFRKLKDGTEQTYNMQVNVPQDATVGTYQVYLWLPDLYNSLRSFPEYSVRFANQNTWNATTGTNLLTTIEIK